MRLAPLALLATLGCAGNRAITGQVLDRNGEPLGQVIVSLEPGNVELLTDPAGRFEIAYLREDDGERKALSPRTAYVLEAFKVGYHLAETSFEYRNGQHEVGTLTLTRDTIRLEAVEQNLDPAGHPDAVRSTGATYEGE